MMIAPVVKINFDDYTELIPAFTVIALMSFTYNIGVGITAGLILYPLVKLAAGRYQRNPRRTVVAMRPVDAVLRFLSLPIGRAVGMRRAEWRIAEPLN